MSKKTFKISNPVIISGKEYHVVTVLDKYGVLKSELHYKSKIIGEKSLKIDPKSDDLTNYITKLHRDFIHELSILNNMTEAEENQQNIKFVLFLGAIYYTKGLYEEAKETFKKALKLDSHCVEAYNYLGNLCIKENNIPQAIDYLKKATSIAPELLDLKLMLIDAYMRLGNLKKVEDELTRTLRYHPDYHFPYWYMCLLDLKKIISGQYEPNQDLKLIDQMIEYLQKGYDIAKELIDKELFEETYVAINAQEFEKAYEALKNLIEKCKDSSMNKDIDNFHMVLMEYKNDKNIEKVKEAIERFKELYEEKPSASLANKIGILKFIVGQHTIRDATEYFESSLKQNSEYVFARKNLTLSKNCLRDLDSLIFDFLKQ